VPTGITLSGCATTSDRRNPNPAALRIANHLLKKGIE
jgi:hypothetical protein